MFSILVPVFNRQVSALAGDLQKAVAKLALPCEIIFAEDGSTLHTDHNKALGMLPGVVYHAFAENVGRAAIRNRMAAMATMPHLIFLDCDSRLPNSKFLVNYAQHLGPDVVCGGRLYPDRVQAAYRLHHKYGSRRESLPAAVRNERPYKGFQTNNFLVKKSLFETVQFDESLTTYGHEDTLFGYALRQMGSTITHIDNPVIHADLERSKAYLHKSKQALANALQLVKDGKLPPGEIKALETYFKLRENGAGRALLDWLEKSEGFLLEKANRPNPRLRSFDFLKLAWLRQLDKAQKEKG